MYTELGDENLVIDTSPHNVAPKTHTKDLKSYIDYRPRPQYNKNNQAIVYLGNRENQAQDIKF